MQTIIIRGQAYDLMKKMPVEKEIAEKYPARFSLYLAKPNGKVLYYAVEYANGSISTVSSLGGLGISRENVQ